MTFDARRKRDQKLTRQIARITLNGVDLPLCDVFYADTRRGIVRGYQRDEHGRAFAHAVTDIRSGETRVEIAKFQRRGRVRFWLKGASTWGASKAARA